MIRSAHSALSTQAVICSLACWRSSPVPADPLLTEDLVDIAEGPDDAQMYPPQLSGLVRVGAEPGDREIGAFGWWLPPASWVILGARARPGWSGALHRIGANT